MKNYFNIAIVLSTLALSPVHADAQNIFQSVKEKFATATSQKKDSEVTAKTSKTKTVKEADPFEMSIDDNIESPAIDAKQHDAVVKYMNALAHKLSARKREKVETMRDGEVLVVTIGTDNIFAPNDTVLRGSAGEFLQPYADLLKQTGMYKILIASHTDDTGSEEYTNHLSEARIDAVYNWLAKGLSSDVMLIPYAMGATEPLVANNSMSNRATNRRIELFIIPDKLMINMAKSQMLQFK